jgi:hypothetical protein
MYPRPTGCDFKVGMRVFTVIMILTLLEACASTPPADREILDEQTGNTLSVVSKPLVFARERTDLAAYARDYATLVAIELDHSGTFENYLLLYCWSTVDRRMLPKATEGSALRLVGDGRQLDLKPLPSLPIAVGKHRQLFWPKHGAPVVSAFAVDQATLRYIAAARSLILRMPDETLDTPFRIWDDGRAALLSFLHATSAR